MGWLTPEKPEIVRTKLERGVEDAQEVLVVKTRVRNTWRIVSAAVVAATALIAPVGINLAWLWLAIPVALVSLIAVFGEGTEVQEARAKYRDAERARQDYELKIQLAAEDEDDRGVGKIRQKYMCGLCHTSAYIVRTPN